MVELLSSQHAVRTATVLLLVGALLAGLTAVFAPSAGAAVLLAFVALVSAWNVARTRQRAIFVGGRATGHKARRRPAVSPASVRTVFLADGTPQTGRVVPVEQADGLELVLTIEGYALADAEGRVVYRLSR